MASLGWAIYVFGNRFRRSCRFPQITVLSCCYGSRLMSGRPGTAMARSRQLPRMQNQSRARAPLERAPNAVPPAPEKKAKSKKPPMMRQYDLVERVRRYNPKTDEALLNRAYVYAMKAHGEQMRASGDPYFSHPIEVAAILTDLKLDDATIAATRAEIDSLFGKDIGALVEGLTKLKKLDLVTKEAKQAENLRKLLLAIADDVRVLLVK